MPWCSVADVTHTRMAPFGARRPPREVVCRRCGQTIPMSDPYWYCCVECPPLCEPCYRAEKEASR